MSKAQVKPIPEGMHSVTPHLVCAGAAEAIDFYKNIGAAFLEEWKPAILIGDALEAVAKEAV